MAHGGAVSKSADAICSTRDFASELVKYVVVVARSGATLNHLSFSCNYNRISQMKEVSRQWFKFKLKVR
jgi:hypothetical protein